MTQAMPGIGNREQVLSHGNTAGREVALDILEAGLAAPDPYDNVRKMVWIEGNRLVVHGPEFAEPRFGRPATTEPLVFDLDEVGDIWVVGGGKAAQREAEALESILGDRITGGQINAKKGDSIRLKRINVTLAGHPMPDAESIAGARRIYEIERSTKKGDIVFHCASGGATALCSLPVPGVSLEDLQQVYRVLYFGKGADMPAANAVRNLIAMLNGKHSRYVREATLVEFLTQETPPNLRVHLYEPPKRADAYDAAIGVLHDFKCWDETPASVKEFLLRRDPRYGRVTNEEVAGRPQHHYRVMGPEYMIEAARERAEALGLNATVSVTSLSDVEAQPVADTFAYMACEAEALGRPLQPPCVFIFGGELLVTVGDATGNGGRNQEFALATAARIAGSRNIVVASADSDGTDGPTTYAGGIADGETLARARAEGFDVAAELANHNSNAVLTRLGDAINTGVRSTNVRDLRVVYVGGRSSS